MFPHELPGAAPVVAVDFVLAHPRRDVLTVEKRHVALAGGLWVQAVVRQHHRLRILELAVRVIVSRLDEGLHYIEAVAFLRREPWQPPIFETFRKVIRVER